jgi:hypothetical protein
VVQGTVLRWSAHPCAQLRVQRLKRHHAILRNVPALSSIATTDGDPNFSPVSFLQEQVQRRGTKIFKPAKVGRGEIFWVASSWDIRRALSNGKRYK